MDAMTDHPASSESHEIPATLSPVTCQRSPPPAGGDATDFKRAVMEALAGRGLAHVLADRAKAARIPTRYAAADIFSLADTIPGGVAPPTYLAAVDTLLSLFGQGNLKGCFSSQPFRDGGIVAIVGPRGTGKTHMACALANLFNGLPGVAGQTSQYRRAFDIFTDIKGSFARAANTTQDRVMAKLEDATLLVIDEAQVRSESAWENDILTSIIDRRYADLRPTLLISNLEAGELLDSLGESVVSRITEAGVIVPANWPSFRTAGRVASN